MSARTIFYASDIHGSELLWRKFLNAGPFYGAEILIMGGDICGKGIVPILTRLDGTWIATRVDQQVVISDETALELLKQDIKFSGMYPYVGSQTEIDAVLSSPVRQDALFEELTTATLEGWLRVADGKLAKSKRSCFVMAGNDDPWSIDAPLESADLVRGCDHRVVDLGDGYSMLSLGVSNPTPWHSPRELSEEELGAKIDELARNVPSMTRAIFNLHVPPYGSDLDTAPVLDSTFRPKTLSGATVTAPAGSTAVRAAIERYQPLLGLHGHIHESKGVTRIGRTLCINPGSSYNTGHLDGAIVRLDGDRIKSYQLVSG